MSNLNDSAFLAQIGATRDHFFFTIGELRESFDLVAPKTNWKDPIDAIVELGTDRDVALMREAVVFMTGSVPVITPAGRPGSIEKFRVEADGYFHAIGA